MPHRVNRVVVQRIIARRSPVDFSYSPAHAIVRAGVVIPAAEEEKTIPRKSEGGIKRWNVSAFYLPDITNRINVNLVSFQTMPANQAVHVRSQYRRILGWENPTEVRAGERDCPSVPSREGLLTGVEY